MPKPERCPTLHPSPWTAASLVLALLLSACPAPSAPPPSPQRVRAYAMFQERCKKSGEFIQKTVEGVEGMYLVNMRMRTNMGESNADQFALDDPYGQDLTKEGYITTFLRNSDHHPDNPPVGDRIPQHLGYHFVEAHDPMDGKLYRYTGRYEEPWQYDKKYLKGFVHFVVDKTPIAERSARYGVKFEDISTREEREHWIAGSSLKVIDLETQEVLGERIGYMVDWAQGSRGGGRSPWLYAADNACPAFDKDFTYKGRGPSSRSQPYQTLRFVEKFLKPMP